MGKFGTLKEDVVEEFDTSVVIDLEKDVCQFCRQGHLTGLKMKETLGFEKEIDDVDEDDEVSNDLEAIKSSIFSTHITDHEEMFSNIWISPYSIKSANSTTSQPQRRFFHFYCAQFGPVSWYDGTNWHNLRSEISRSRGLRCGFCSTNGATLGCNKTRCHFVTHIPCALSHGYLPRRINGLNRFYCEQHRKEIETENQIRIAQSMRDVSRGREALSIECPSVNDLHEILNDFEYFNYCVDSDDVIVSKRNIREIACCDCVGPCDNIKDCACLAASQVNYSKIGLLNQDITNPIIECNLQCSCSLRRCKNRIVQQGMKYKLEVFRYDDTFVSSSSSSKKRKRPSLTQNTWGVRTKYHIPQGGFICEVVGQYVLGRTLKSYHCRDGTIKSDGELVKTLVSSNPKDALNQSRIFLIEAWEDDNYFDKSLIEYVKMLLSSQQDRLGKHNVTYETVYEADYFADPDADIQSISIQKVKKSPISVDDCLSYLRDQIFIDCRYHANIVRFIRRRTYLENPILERRLVYDDSSRTGFPRLALFAAVDIPAGSELFI